MKQSELRVAYAHVLCGTAVLIALLSVEQPFRWLQFEVQEHIWLLGMLAFAEALYGVGLYFPGTFILAFSVVAAVCDVSFAVPAIVAMWLGMLFGLAANIAFARYFLSSGRQTGEAATNTLLIGAALSAFHPNVAGIFVVHWAAHGKLTRTHMAAIAGSSALFLSLYMFLLCRFGGFVRENQNELSFLWAVGLILVGLNQIRRLRKTSYQR